MITKEQREEMRIEVQSRCVFSGQQIIALIDTIDKMEAEIERFKMCGNSESRTDKLGNYDGLEDEDE